MVIKQNVPLSELTTMKIGGAASAVITVTSVSEMIGALQQVKSSGLPYRVLGWGSNVIGRDEGFAGVVIINKIGGFEVLKEIEQGARIRAGAGETLDTVVARTVEMGLSGIEALSSIPGTIGAAPVQNAGAYGQEIGDHLESVEAIDTNSLETVVLSKGDCAFGYRDSVFKHNNRGFVITAVTLVLPRGNPTPPFYDSLSRYFEEHGTSTYTPATVRDAVIAIRKEKLPSPLLLPNSGSFFKNPIISKDEALTFRINNPDAPSHDMADGTVKIPAGWLLEHAGFKGKRDGALETYGKNALVLVNSGKATYSDLDAFRSTIQSAVKEQFGIEISQEPEELTAD